MTTQVPTPTNATSPSSLLRLLDRVITRLARLPAPTSAYTITRDLRIPTRDGVELLADMYTPTAPPCGTLLVRSPYGYPAVMVAGMGTVYASRGYRVLLARCRGTFGSGGAFEPMIHEVDDAADTVAWMRDQAWFDGRFATWGGSYLGFTQWALLVDPPPELVTAVISIGPHDFRAAAYQGGAFNVNDFLGWSHGMSRQDDAGAVRTLLSGVRGQRALAQAVRGVPLVDAGNALLDGRGPWYREWVGRRDPDDPFWAPMKLEVALERVQVPVLLQAGWQDLFLDQTLEQYARLSARGVDVALTVGPWTHLDVGMKGSRVVMPEVLDWLAEHLGGSGLRTRAAPVKVFVTGADQWRDLPRWPPPTNDRTFHLQPEGGLGDDPAPEGTRAEFTYDPVDPTPTVGGRILAPRISGYTDDAALAERRDVVAFTGARLTAPLEVLGAPVVTIAHSSDNPHADLFVRLSEVTPDGRSRNVSEGFLRLDPEATTGEIRLELDAVAHRFAAGSRIRVVIAGGSFPRWERNLGTDEDPATSTRMAPSHRTIDLGASRLVLPCAASG
jgi:putative CocE/NonD family hydrolase